MWSQFIRITHGPISPPSGSKRSFVADLKRKRRDLGKHRVVIVKVGRNVILLAEVVIDTNVVVLPMVRAGAADIRVRNRRNEIVQRSGEASDSVEI